MPLKRTYNLSVFRIRCKLASPWSVRRGWLEHYLERAHIATLAKEKGIVQLGPSASDQRFLGELSAYYWLVHRELLCKLQRRISYACLSVRMTQLRSIPDDYAYCSPLYLLDSAFETSKYFQMYARSPPVKYCKSVVAQCCSDLGR